MHMVSDLKLSTSHMGIEQVLSIEACLLEIEGETCTRAVRNVLNAAAVCNLF
jgi:hypothetical protein